MILKTDGPSYGMTLKKDWPFLFKSVSLPFHHSFGMRPTHGPLHVGDTKDHIQGYYLCLEGESCYQGMSNAKQVRIQGVYDMLIKEIQVI